MDGVGGTFVGDGGSVAEVVESAEGRVVVVPGEGESLHGGFDDLVGLVRAVNAVLEGEFDGFSLGFFKLLLVYEVAVVGFSEAFQNIVGGVERAVVGFGGSEDSAVPAAVGHLDVEDGFGEGLDARVFGSVCGEDAEVEAGVAEV